MVEIKNHVPAVFGLVLLLNAPWFWNAFAMVFSDEEYRRPIFEGAIDGKSDLLLSKGELGAGTFTIWANAYGVAIPDGTTHAIKMKIFIGDEGHDVLARGVVYGGSFSSKVHTISVSLREAKFGSEQIKVTGESNELIPRLGINIYRAY